MYEIGVDVRSAMIEVKLGGLMTAVEVATYVDELKRQFVAHRLRRYVMVIDVTDCPIQPQDVIRAIGGHMATMPKAAALAIVTGGSLVKMQVRRLFTQPYARVTHTPQAGRAWVLQGVEPAASPAPSGHPAPPAIARA